MASKLPSENPGNASRSGEGRGDVNISGAARSNGTRSMEEFEKALISIRQARDTVIARNLDLSSKLAVAEDRIAELEYEREAADQARDAALALVQDLSRQADETREKLLALTGEQAGVKSVAPAAAPADEEGSVEFAGFSDDPGTDGVLQDSIQTEQEATLNEQLDAAQRARDIAVAAITNTQRQVERLDNERRDLRAQIEADKATFEARLAQLESRLKARAASSLEPSVEPAAEINFFDPLAAVISEDARAATLSIRSCVESLAGSPDNRAILGELDELFHGYAANAGGVGHGGIARFSAACGELTRWLCKTPRKVESTLPTLREAAKLLVELSESVHPDRIADPAGDLVYSVDDDPDNCECIAMAMEKMALKTRYAMKPEIALADLAKLPCSIITLDVDLPGMDGFELFERIRAQELHRDTPIIFLSGLISTKERIGSLPGSRHSFVAKPYNLNELGVVTLAMILKERLAADAGEVILEVV